MDEESNVCVNVCMSEELSSETKSAGDFNTPELYSWLSRQEAQLRLKSFRERMRRSGR